MCCKFFSALTLICWPQMTSYYHRESSMRWIINWRKGLYLQIDWILCKTKVKFKLGFTIWGIPYTYESKDHMIILLRILLENENEVTICEEYGTYIHEVIKLFRSRLHTEIRVLTVLHACLIIARLCLVLLYMWMSATQLLNAVTSFPASAYNVICVIIFRRHLLQLHLTNLLVIKRHL